MAKDSINNTLISLSIIKVNWDNQRGDYLDNFLPFLSTLFARKNYEYIEESNESIARLTADFKSEFGLNIPYHPLISILNKAKRKGLIEKREHRFYPTKTIYKYDFTDKVEQHIRKYEEIVDAFIEFSRQEYETELDKKEAEKTLIHFLKQYDLEILFTVYDKSALPEVEASEQNLFIFSKFVQNLYSQQYEIFLLFLDIVIGYTLTNVVLNGEEFKNFSEPKLKGLNLYLDTRIILRLLGTEGREIQIVYEDLLGEFRREGIDISIFSHTYDEIIGILQGCLQWIENPDYDASEASTVLRFFKSEDYRESDVQIFINRLDNTLKEYGIKKIDSPNYKDYSNYLIDEKKLEELIKETYKTRNVESKYYEKSFTIEKDIRSFTSVYILRKGQKPVNIKQTKHLFVTTNAPLVYATKKFEKEIQYKEGFYIPVCVTDAFIATLIWLRNPNKVIEISEKKIMANVHSALQPSEELLRQYIVEIKKLRENGKITEEDYILLRDSQLAQELLGEKTLGDPQKFMPQTPGEILDAIKSEAYEKYNQEKNEHERTKEELEKERKEKEEISKKLNKKAEKWANIGGYFIATLFIALTICSWFKIEGILKWITSIVLSGFSIMSLLGLTRNTLKRKIKDLILNKFLG